MQSCNYCKHYLFVVLVKSTQLSAFPLHSFILCLTHCLPLMCRITLGNQLDGIHLLDPEVVAQFKNRYPDGVISKPKTMQ